MPWVFPVGYSQGRCGRGVWVVPLLGSRVWKEGSLPAGRGCVSIGSSSSGAGRGQDLPCLACCLPAPGSPCSCSLPAQVPWLHMLYAAIGAIAFTLVS